jgi:hypothetical protein
MPKYIGSGAVAARYNKHQRTIDRWVETGELPPPVYISKRRHWAVEELDARDAARTAATSHEPKPYPPQSTGARCS